MVYYEIKVNDICARGGSMKQTKSDVMNEMIKSILEQLVETIIENNGSEYYSGKMAEYREIIGIVRDTLEKNEIDTEMCIRDR